MTAHLVRLKQLYEIGGFSEVFRGVRDYLKYNILPVDQVNYSKKRVDNEDRWNFISPHVQGAEKVYDIGCADGYFTIQAAKEGISATGVDVDEERIEAARRKAKQEHLSDAYVQFKTKTITPQNIEQISDTDVIFLLTVHHHWKKHYNSEQAEQMLRTVMGKCNTLIYEPPGNQFVFTEEDSLNPTQCLRIYSDYLMSNYGDSIEIVDNKLFDYKGEFDRKAFLSQEVDADDKKPPRKDPIFVIDSSDYTCDQ